MPDFAKKKDAEKNPFADQGSVSFRPGKNEDSFVYSPSAAKAPPKNAAPEPQTDGTDEHSVSTEDPPEKINRQFLAVIRKLNGMNQTQAAEAEAFVEKNWRQWVKPVQKFADSYVDVFPTLDADVQFYEVAILRELVAVHSRTGHEIYVGLESSSQDANENPSQSGELGGHLVSTEDPPQKINRQFLTVLRKLNGMNQTQYAEAEAFVEKNWRQWVKPVQKLAERYVDVFPNLDGDVEIYEVAILRELRAVKARTGHEIYID